MSFMLNTKLQVWPENVNHALAAFFARRLKWRLVRELSRTNGQYVP